MTTIKISVNGDTPLGRHVLALKSRERSREIYMLASLGLATLEGSRAETAHEKKSLLADNSFSQNVKTVDDAAAVPKGIGDIDFGDELLNL